MLVHIARAFAQTTLIPVAVLSDGESRNKDAPNPLKVISLDFATEPARQSAPLANRILQRLEACRQQQSPALPGSNARLLGPVMEVAETQAATGWLALTASQTQRLALASQQLLPAGLDTLDAALQTQVRAQNAQSLLRLYHLCELPTEIDALPNAGVQ